MIKIKKIRNDGFSADVFLISLLIIIALAGVGWRLWSNAKNKPAAKSNGSAQSSEIQR
jgi:hypothetical protein